LVGCPSISDGHFCEKPNAPRSFTSASSASGSHNCVRSSGGWGRARESEARLWVAGRRVKLVPPRLPPASTFTRRPAPGTLPLGFRARRIASRIRRAPRRLSHFLYIRRGMCGRIVSRPVQNIAVKDEAVLRQRDSGRPGLTSLSTADCRQLTRPRRPYNPALTHQTPTTANWFCLPLRGNQRNSSTPALSSSQPSLLRIVECGRIPCLFQKQLSYDGRHPH